MHQNPTLVLSAESSSLTFTGYANNNIVLLGKIESLGKKAHLSYCASTPTGGAAWHDAIQDIQTHTAASHEVQRILAGAKLYPKLIMHKLAGVQQERPVTKEFMTQFAGYKELAPAERSGCIAVMEEFFSPDVTAIASRKFE